MFVTFNMGNYEEDSIGHKLRYIDAISEDEQYYGTLERYTHHYDPNTSLYGRQVTKEIKAIGKFIKDIEKEIRDNKKRIEYYVDSGKMGGQRETEIRNVVQNYYKMKLDGFKTRAGLIRELDKSRKEDLKLQKDLLGKVEGSSLDSIGLNDRSSDRSFMSNVIGGNVDQFFNNSNNSLYTAAPNQTYTPQPVQTPIQPVQPAPQPIPQKPLEVMKQPEPESVVEEKKEETPVYENGKVVQYIKNANGEDVPIYAEGPDDFVDGKTYTNAKLAFENISLSRDPNVEKVFKFNEDEGVGWLAYYDLANKKEIKDKGSLRNIEQIFPFEIDKENNLVTTVLRETYPVVYTDEEPSEEVRNEYERLEKIEEDRKERQNS